MTLPRTLEPELMDTATEAEDYDAMDHTQVNGVFCDDLLIRRPALKWVLDLGTGTARIPITLCAKHPRVNVIAIDLAEHMIRVASKNVHDAGFGERIALWVDDAKAPRAFEEPFDVVCSNSVVHHIPDPAIALAAWWARVPPGGLFFVRDLARPDTADEVDALVAKHGGKAPDDPEDREAHARQVALFHASLHAALRVDEVQRVVETLGIPASAITATSDRHWTIAHEKPR